MSDATTEPAADEDATIVLTSAEHDALVRVIDAAYATLGHFPLRPVLAEIEHIIAVRSGGLREAALREAAEDFRTNAARAWGDERGWYTTGKHVANLAADWLNEAADDLRAAHGGDQ